MFKPCPNCGFLVALIAGRAASQRCPRCGSALLADGELPEPVDDAPRRRHADTPRDEPAAPRADASDRIARPPLADEARGDAAFATHTVDPADEEPDAIRAVAAPAHVDVEAVAPATPFARDAKPDGPSFARRRDTAARKHGRRWPWAVALPALALLLGLQIVLAQRVELARDARWRPLVAQVCGVLGCDVPAWREPKAFRMLSHAVRPDRARAGVLHASTTVRNDARWPQPPPTVVLSLSDVDGRLLGARAVTPADYGRRGDALVAPGHSIDIAFDVREPAGRVEAYDFQLQ
ncbi:MAG TPA: DUF3426 domain-containing protein [Lysobacter sp.]|nr:DUF3426 domain-containing protein [Lysobacter sp.]